MTIQKDIRALNREELREYFVSIGDKAFRGNQVHDWLWKKGATEFDDMSNISKEVRARLQEDFVINNIEVAKLQHSTDGTIKNAIRLHDGLMVESVMIPTSKRSTACVSSQVGCSLNCEFCATARLKRMRNLNPDEIYDQVVVIDRQSREHTGRPLSNIVFMGMGEPLMNFKNVLKAVDKITGDEGLGMSPRRITISTSGIPKMIKKLADEQPRFKLALSLHSAIDEVRTTIMPFNEQFPLADIADSLRYWHERTHSPVTYEYVVWQGVNDKQKDVDALVKFCKIIPCKVNLIQYNSIDDPRFVQASHSAVQNYLTTLERHGITATVRRSRGQDIDAACGQLANKES